MKELELLRIYFQQEFSLELADRLSNENLKENIAVYINHLITNDFRQLVNLLYKMDINESRLQQLLKENPSEEAGQIIAHLIVERQLQKIQTRQDFKKNDSQSEEEKW